MDALISITPEAQELIQFASTFLATATAIKITTPEEAQAAVEQTRAIKECAKAVEETRKSYTTPLDDAKLRYQDMFNPAKNVLAKAEQVLKAEIGRWQVELVRQEAEERHLEAQRQAAAAELLRKADAAAEQGDYAQAEALEAQVVQAQEVYPVALVIEKPKGTSGRTIWKCKVIDPTLVPRDWCCPDQSALDAYAAARKGTGPAPAGCEWTSTISVSIR